MNIRNLIYFILSKHPHNFEIIIFKSDKNYQKKYNHHTELTCYMKNKKVRAYTFNIFSNALTIFI